MQSHAVLIFCGLILLAGCSHQLSGDIARLDTLLSGSGIDRVELVRRSSPQFRTNTLTGIAAEKFVLSLNKTNRLDSPDETKEAVNMTARLMSGTNQVCGLDQFESGLWRFGEYSFFVRSTP